MKNYLNFLAFTLAEVLITIGIIGIVASLTIPTLISNYQNQANVSSLKKFYTSMNQALQLYAAEQGSPGNLRLANLFDSSDDETMTIERLSKYLKIQKNCGTGTGCFPSLRYKLLNGNTTSGPYPDAETSMNRFILADGTLVELNQNGYNNCSSNNNDKTKSCAVLMIDVNGFKGPNIVGRDYFLIDIIDNATLQPRGSHLSSVTAVHWDDGNASYKCDLLNQGHGCAGRILEQNWQMLY